MYLAEHSGLISASSRDLDNFVIQRPTTIEEAAVLLADMDSNPVAYAGGTDLVAAFREGKTIGTLVWLKGVKDLQEISISNDILRIGALVTLGEGSDSDLINIVPGFKKAWGQIANIRIRFSATIGGNLMARRTGYEMSILLSALGAKINLVNGKDTVSITPEELWEHPGLGQSLLTSIDIPLEGKPALDYERSMWPLVTQAVVLRGGYDGSLGRAVIATRHLRPKIFEFSGNTSNLAEVYKNLPNDFADPLLDNAYLRSLAPIFLERQLARLAGDA
jgi:carbon-monoxide dehydrogenase medium subunit